MALYADIVGIDAPFEAWPGDTVTVVVDVKNISSGWLYAILTGIIEHDTTQVSFNTSYGYVGPGGVIPFTIHFDMPGSNVRFHVASWYWDGAEWVQDDYDYVDIRLAGVGPYADIQALTVPATAAEGETVNITARIRNISSTAMSIAISGLFYYDTMARDIKFPTPSMENILPGEDGYFYGSFVMPNSSGTVWVKSWRLGTDGQWYGEDEETALVTLVEEPVLPEFSEFAISTFNKV